jgi:CHAD domain-containing protein
MVLFSQWDEFCRLRTVVLGHHDTDSIHDLRVTSRRMRATLSLFLPFISAKSVKTILQEMQQVTRALGHVRNIDEAIIYFSATSVAHPALTEGLRRIRKKEIRAVIKILEKFPCQDLSKILQKTVAELTTRHSNDDIDQRLPVYLSETSLQRYHAVYDLLTPATIPENVKIRHGLRIAIKKWRYLLETIGQVCGQDYDATLESLKDYQTVLGRLNDVVEFGVLSEHLKLPAEEIKAIKTALNLESAQCFARFVEVTASRPLHFTFLL